MISMSNTCSMHQIHYTAPAKIWIYQTHFAHCSCINEWGYRPPMSTYRLNWVRRTSCGWWDLGDDTTLQTQDSKYEPWRSKVERVNSRSRRLYTILNLYEWVGKEHFVYSKLECHSGVQGRDLRAAALPTSPGNQPPEIRQQYGIR